MSSNEKHSGFSEGEKSPPKNATDRKVLDLSDSDSDSLSLTDYEFAIDAAGYGSFHWWLLFVCGWANASDAVEILCISFLLPSAECDLQLSSADKGWLSGIMFVGMLIGGYIWGALGDAFGRRKILILAMFVNAFCGFGSSFCQDKESFITMRFFSGLGVGGSIPIVWSYFAEFQPKAKRGGMLSFLATFWMIGNITVAGVAWLIIPHDIGVNPEEGFKYNSWRIFVLVCGIPAFSVAVALFWFPESPKYLIAKGQNHRALKIFSKIYSQNTGKPASSYPVSRIEGVSVVTSSLSYNMKELFSGALLKVVLFMIYINFAIQFGYYGLWLWFPELFNRLDEYYAHHNETKSVCEVSNLVNSTASNEPECNGPPGSDVFLNSFIISCAALPGNIWTILQMDKLGRKFFLVLSMTLSGACAFLIYVVTSQTTNLLVSIAFGLVSTMGFNALDCLGIELFPTHLRSTAMAVTLIPARLGALFGNIVFGLAIDVNCAIPILSVAALLVSGGLVGLVLPNTTRTSLA